MIVIGGAGSVGGAAAGGYAELTGNLAGSGASSMQNAQTAWTESFMGLTQAEGGDLTVTYDPTGSGTGREQFLSGQVQFAGTDAALDEEELTRWSLDRERSLTPAEAAKDPAVLETIQEAVDRVNEDVSRAESIRRIRILDHAFTEDSGYVTPSQKLKRAQVIEDYAEDVDALYR